MLKKRLIPLLFALAYVVVPPSAVYLQVTLTDGAAIHSMSTPDVPVTPAILRAPPQDLKPLTVL